MNKRILIIGGMGPQASLLLHQRLIELAAKGLPKSNHEYPQITHVSLPVHDFISNREHTKSAEKMLKKSISKFGPSDFDHVVIACNTAHLLADKVERFVGIKPMSLIEQAVKFASENNLTSIGILASPVTIDSGMYHSQLRSMNILMPDSKAIRTVEKLIRNVISNKRIAREITTLESIILELQVKGAQKVILGCTELSVIATHSKIKNIIDPLELAAKKLMEHSKMEER